MKKLVEIPFNHELIRQQGIEVKYRNGGKVLNIQYFKNAANKYCVFSVDEQGSIRNHLKTGNYLIRKSEHQHDLKMYKEIEVREPRVIWVNIYPDNVRYYHSSKECAEQNKRTDCLETVKFIEVIEEGE